MNQTVNILKGVTGIVLSTFFDQITMEDVESFVRISVQLTIGMATVASLFLKFKNRKDDQE